MPKIGNNNEPLLERALFVHDGTLWRPLLGNTSGQIIAALGTDQNVQARAHGYVGGAWQKSPIPFGYSDLAVYLLGSATLAAGTNTFNTTAVASGKLVVLTNISMYYVGTVAGVSLYAQLAIDSTVVTQFTQQPPVSNQNYDRQGNWLLAAGDNLRFVIAGATLNDSAFLSANGYVVDINL